jgi:hypothetical protein
MERGIEDFNRDRTASDNDIEMDVAVQSAVNELSNIVGADGANEHSVGSRSSQTIRSVAELGQRCATSTSTTSNRRLKLQKKRLTTMLFEAIV